MTTRHHDGFSLWNSSSNPFNVCTHAPRHATPCRAVPCHAVPCRAVLCRAVTYHAVAYNTNGTRTQYVCAHAHAQIRTCKQLHTRKHALALTRCGYKVYSEQSLGHVEPWNAYRCLMGRRILCKGAEIFSGRRIFFYFQLVCPLRSHAPEFKGNGPLESL